MEMIRHYHVIYRSQILSHLQAAKPFTLNYLAQGKQFNFAINNIPENALPIRCTYCYEIPAACAVVVPIYTYMLTLIIGHATNVGAARGSPKLPIAYMISGAIAPMVHPCIYEV